MYNQIIYNNTGSQNYIKNGKAIILQKTRYMLV